MLNNPLIGLKKNNTNSYARNHHILYMVEYDSQMNRDKITILTKTKAQNCWDGNTHIPCEQAMTEPLQDQHCHRVHLYFGQLHIVKFESLVVV